MSAGRRILTRADVAALAPALQVRIARDPLLQYELLSPGRGGMSIGQERLHRLQCNNRMCRACNQVGKTHALCAELHWQGLGRHPFRAIRRDQGVSYCVIKDFDNGYHEFCGKLRALQPPDVLHPSCEWSMLGGYTVLDKGHRRRLIMYKDGYRIEFKGGKQDSVAMESATVDAVFFDEPPKPAHWGAARARLSVANGPTLIAMTPIGRPVGWLRKTVEGDPKKNEKPREHWEQVVIELTPENAPHRTPESILAQIARTDTWDIPQRIRGEWEGVTEGRRFSAMKDSHIIPLADAMAYNISHYRLSGDYGEGPGKTAFYLQGIVGNREPYTYIVLGEYVSEERTTPTQDAVGVVDMIRAVGIDPREIARAFGDVNSSGKLGAGSSCNEEMERAIARILKVSRCPFTFEVPDKGKGSVSFGEGGMSHAMIEDRFFVVDDCASLLSSIRNYTGKEESLKHAIDGVRYGIADLLANGMPLEEQVQADYAFLLGR